MKKPAAKTSPCFINPPPRVRINPNTYKWKCPCCGKRNDDGDTTCIFCGQDIEIAP